MSCKPSEEFQRCRGQNVLLRCDEGHKVEKSDEEKNAAELTVTEQTDGEKGSRSWRSLKSCT